MENCYSKMLLQFSELVFGKTSILIHVFFQHVSFQKVGTREKLMGIVEQN